MKCEIIPIMMSLCLTLSGARSEEAVSTLSYCQPDTCSLIRDLAVLKEKLGAVETVNKAQEEELNKLRNLAAAGQPKVAFSAALRTSGSGNIGPFTTDTPLQYKRVLSNFGSGYNPATGVFTAMVKGVYFFRYTMFYNGNANAVVILRKNEELVVATWDVGARTAQNFASNAAIIELEVGDNVFAQLSANREVFDDSGNYNTFSGFLLFSL